MLRKAFNWLLLVLPSGSIVGLAFCMWLLIEGAAAICNWQFPFPGAVEPIWRMRDFYAIAACAMLGLIRVAGLHPLYNRAYREWLASTPWRRGLPLPVGPVHLAPQDGVILAVTLLALHDSQLPRLACVAAFLVAYLGQLLHSFASLRFRRAFYPLAFALGWAVWLGLLSWPGFALLALLVAASQFLLSQSLDEFPWQGRRPFGETTDPRQPTQLQAASVGWPFSQMQPKEPEARIDYRDGILCSLLVGWWTFSLGSLVSDAEAQLLLSRAIQYFLPLLFILVRLFVYLPGFCPPINLPGRLLTLRWLVPDYDRVFAAPLCILLTAAFAPAAIDDLSAWLGVALPTPQIVLSLSLLAALNLGPTLREWQLASRCRIVPGVLNAKEFVEL